VRKYTLRVVESGHVFSDVRQLYGKNESSTLSISTELCILNICRFSLVVVSLEPYIHGYQESTILKQVLQKLQSLDAELFVSIKEASMTEDE
jgi:hypothetical protein